MIFIITAKWVGAPLVNVSYAQTSCLSIAPLYVCFALVRCALRLHQAPLCVLLVLDSIRIAPCFALPQSCPIFGYRVSYIAFNVSYIDNIGKITDITKTPTTPAKITIINGSIAAIKDCTASSTSSS